MHPGIQITMIVIPCVGDIFSCFLIYAILRKTPEEMKRLRLVLAKTTIVETFWLHVIVWALQPETYFPIPLTRFNGILKVFGNIGGTLGCGLFYISAFFIGAALFEFHLLRLVTTYNIRWIMAFFRGKLFVLVETAIIVGAAIWLAVYTKYRPQRDPRRALVLAKDQNLSNLVENIDFENDALFFTENDAYSYLSKAVCLVACVIGILIFFLATKMTHSKIFEHADSLSSSMRSLQRRLTYLMIAQTSLPIIVLVIPLAAYIILVLLVPGEVGFDPHFINDILIRIIGLFWIFYPSLNTALTFYLIVPYRKFFVSFFKKLYSRVFSTTQIETDSSPGSSDFAS